MGPSEGVREQSVKDVPEIVYIHEGRNDPEAIYSQAQQYLDNGE
jgi:hypothetical protein